MIRTWPRALILVALFALPAVPAAAERMNDKAVEQQSKQIKEGFEIWKQALEQGNLEDAVIRSAAGTIDVQEYLKSFAKDIDTFNDCFKGTRSAGTEALALLLRASDVERRVRQQGGIRRPPSGRRSRASARGSRPPTGPSSRSSRRTRR